MEGRVHSIETFGTVDGPGIRFVLFLKGCPLRCKYCHNPDTWNMDGAKIYSAEEIINKFLKYKNYYVNGGITISGGEPLMQIDFVIELFRACKQHNIHTALDTSGILYSKDDYRFNELIKYCDLFLLDIKHIDSKKHEKLTGKGNESVLEFARFLSENHKKIWIRHVLVDGITTEQELLKGLRKFIDSLEIEKVEVIPYHKMGIKKYEMLNIPYSLLDVEPPSKEMIAIANKILKEGYE